MPRHEGSTPSVRTYTLFCRYSSVGQSASLRSLRPGVRTPLPTLREGGPWYLNVAHNPELSRVHAGSRHHLWEVAQLAERVALDHEVAGSTPAFPASNTQADVVELVDTPGRGPGAPRALRVRPPPSALFQRRVAQFGRAPGLHPERREFNSLLADYLFSKHTRSSPNGKAPALQAGSWEFNSPRPPSAVPMAR